MRDVFKQSLSMGPFLLPAAGSRCFVHPRYLASKHKTLLTGDQ